MLFYDVHVLVAAPGEVDDDMPPCGEFFVVLEYPCQRVRGFQRGKDAFGAAEGLEGVERLGIVGEPIMDAPDGVQIGVLRTDAGVVEPGGNGM